MILLWLLGMLVAMALFGFAMRVFVVVVRLTLASAGALAFAFAAGLLFGVDPLFKSRSWAGLFLIGLIPALWIAFRVGNGAKSRVRLRPGQGTVLVLQPVESLSLARPHADMLAQIDKAGRTSRWAGRRRRELAAVRQLSVAWEILAAISEGHRARIAVARAGCQRLTGLAADGLVSPSAQDALTGITKGVPELTRDCLRHMASVADAAGRAVALSRAVETLERVAARAEREADMLARDHAAAFDLTRGHLNQRSSEDRLAF